MQQRKKNPSAGGAGARSPYNKQAKQHSAPAALVQTVLAIRCTPRWLHGDPEWLEGISAAIADETERLLAAEGLSALEMPKSAACAHEAGHAVIATALGATVTCVKIKRNRKHEQISGRPVWGGYTSGGEAWRIERDTPADEIRRRICYIVAGLTAECVLDADGVRDSSSLDELVTAQAISAMLHDREGYDGHPKQTFCECWSWTATVIKWNEAIARQLMHKLDATHKVRGKPLTVILRQVQKPPPELMQHVIERVRAGGAS